MWGMVLTANHKEGSQCVRAGCSAQPLLKCTQSFVWRELILINISAVTLIVMYLYNS